MHLARNCSACCPIAKFATATAILVPPAVELWAEATCLMADLAGVPHVAAIGKEEESLQEESLLVGISAVSGDPGRQGPGLDSRH